MAEVLAEYERLVSEQRALEQAIAAVVEELTSGENPAGLSGALVDADGFPRADIDVYRVRHLRHDFAVKQSDHRAVMRRIEELLPQVFAAKVAAAKAAATHDATQLPDSRAGGDASSAPAATVAATAVETPAATVDRQIDAAERAKKPFATVQSIQTDSPAEWAGLHAADQVLAFGTADATNHRNLEAIKEIVMHNIGSPLRVLVRRSSGGAWGFLELVLTPQQWRGPGVLGCLLMPLQDDDALSSSP